MNYSGIKNLLIDLGDVLYKINLKAMLDALEALRPTDSAPIDYSKGNQHQVFIQLEKGQVSSEEFVNELRNTYHIQGDTATVLEAWSKVLVGVIPQREQQIKQLSEYYPLALLSNTNAPHHEKFGSEMEPIFAYFQKLFLSYQMNLAKPQAEIYLRVLEEMNWKAEETLFIDDSTTNIQGAKEVGLHTYWVKEPSYFDTLATELIQMHPTV